MNGFFHCSKIPHLSFIWPITYKTVLICKGILLLNKIENVIHVDSAIVCLYQQHRLSYFEKKEEKFDF